LLSCLTDLSLSPLSRHETRTLFCKTEAERDSWLTALQHAAQVIPIEEDYVIGNELGRGRFSTVCDCVHKVTQVKYAVKIIEKASIEAEDKALLRTEIAVLKLVNHPNIIKLQGVYESRGRLYIVMEKLVGGELFERIVGRPRFSEEEAAKLIRPLLESVAYLHDLGIVHRDIKPENILCGDNLDEIKIADFGLSKVLLLAPHCTHLPLSLDCRCSSQRSGWMPRVGPYRMSPLRSLPCKATDRRPISGLLGSSSSWSSVERSLFSLPLSSDPLPPVAI
jgi:serine/threonine protein kinase